MSATGRIRPVRYRRKARRWNTGLAVATAFLWRLPQKPSIPFDVERGGDMETWQWALVAVAGGVVFFAGLALMKKGR